jgi:hypothetical protein
VIEPAVLAEVEDLVLALEVVVEVAGSASAAMSRIPALA